MESLEPHFGGIENTVTLSIADGHGDVEAQLTPLMVMGLQSVRVHSVAAVCGISLATTSDGETYGGGFGFRGGQPDPELGLELTGGQRVLRKYPGLRVIHAYARVPALDSLRWVCTGFRRLTSASQALVGHTVGGEGGFEPGFARKSERERER